MNTTKPTTARRLKQCEEKGTPIVPITRPLEFNVETEKEYLENMTRRHGRDPEEWDTRTQTTAARRDLRRPQYVHLRGPHACMHTFHSLVRTFLAPALRCSSFHRHFQIIICTATLQTAPLYPASNPSPSISIYPPVVYPHKTTPNPLLQTTMPTLLEHRPAVSPS